MSYRCANPSCDFTYESMRAICADPVCLERTMTGCGRYVRIERDGSVTPLPSEAAPPECDPAVAWLCCYCATQHEVVGPGHVRLASDPFGFIWWWQIENAEASTAHEVG